MKFIKDLKRVLTRSISFWFGIAGLVLLLVPDLIFNVYNIDIDPVFVFWTIYGLLFVGVVGRLFEQNYSIYFEWARMLLILITVFTVAYLNSSYAHDCEPAGLTSTQDSEALDIAVPLIATWEGLRTQAYLDIVGVPTICYGSTRGVELGMSKTKEECDSLLRDEVAEYRAGWLEYLSEEAYQNWLPATRDAAYTSLTYNVGITAAGRSTATRRLNAQNIEGGCIAIGWWNRAGGRVVLGLVNRRKQEVELCMLE